MVSQEGRARFGACPSGPALWPHRRSQRFAEVEPYRSRLPVICIGNFTAGGGGKTPTAIAVAALLAELGARPAFLTRGYGGTSEGPVLVAKGQSAEEVGDEPLLLAEAAPTMVAADRKAGAAALEATEADIIVMDDGLQNPRLAKDLSLVVVDAAAGLGNGLIMPAGPLRAPLDAQIARVERAHRDRRRQQGRAVDRCLRRPRQARAQSPHGAAPGQALARRAAGDRLRRDRAA